MAPLEPEIEEILENIDGKIEKHDEQITDLRINTGKMEQKLNNIEYTMQEIQHSYMKGQTLILGTLQDMTNQITKLSTMILETQKNKDNNKSNLYFKIVATIGGFLTLIGTYFFGKSQ